MSSSDDSSTEIKRTNYKVIKSSKKFAAWKSLTLANAASAGIDRYLLTNQTVQSEEEVDLLNIDYININSRDNPQESKRAKNHWEREKKKRKRWLAANKLLTNSVTPTMLIKLMQVESPK